MGTDGHSIGTTNAFLDHYTYGTMVTNTTTGSRSIPLAVVHFGKGSFCLKYALKSAERYTGNVTLIGDQSNSHNWHRHCDAGRLDGSRYEQFCSGYIHRSSNSKTFEMACFKRFFILLEWMKQNNLDRIILLDSDIVTCSKLGDEIAAIVGDHSAAAYMRPTEQGDMQWTASPHVSYWTQTGLEEFTEFCLRANRLPELIDKLNSKWKWHQDSKQLGGICDMTYLYLWGLGRTDVISLCPVRNRKTIDFSINLSQNDYKNEYRMFCGVKSIGFRGGVPYGFNNRLNEKTQFLALHCQARNKSITAFLYYSPLRRMYWTTKPVYLAMRAVVRTSRRLIGRRTTD